MRIVIIILFISLNASYAQTSDFIILKKKDKTIRSYYAGTQIEFTTTNGVYKNALINRIANDTVYLQEFLVRTVQTSLGFYIRDTAGSFRYAYHYQQIGSIGKQKKGFDTRGSGAALFGGGIVLTLGSGIVYLADRKKFSPGLLIASTGLAAVGYLMMRSGNKGMQIGKRNYRIEYISLSGDKK